MQSTVLQQCANFVKHLNSSIALLYVAGGNEGASD